MSLYKNVKIMSTSAVIPLEVLPSAEIPIRNGTEVAIDSPRTETQAHHAILADLPGYSTIFNVDTTGEELGRLFAQYPDLPGAILFDENGFRGVISQSHFYKCISRTFGREIYYRRPASVMLNEMTVPPLILPFDCPIQTAVEQCLARPLNFIYEPFLIYEPESGEYNLCSLQILLLASSRLASLRNRQMEQILNSVTDGLLVIDRDFRIGGEYSKVVEALFERTDLRNLSLPEVLLPILDPVTHEQLHEYLRILFDPKLIDRLIKSINPAKQISVRFSSSDLGQERIKHFTLNFERIRTGKEISQVLVRIEDITQRINLARELEQQEAVAEKKLQLIMQILQVEPKVLNRFISCFNEGLSTLEHLLGAPDDSRDPRETIHALFRSAHTLKSEASFLRLTAYERALHRLEDQLEKLRVLPRLETGDLALLQPSLEALQRLGGQIHQALEQLKQFDAPAKPSAQAPSSPVTSREAGPMEMLAQVIAEISERLGKPALFHTSVRDDDLPEKYREVLHEVLIHLARNALVHGIEPADERKARGKNPTGLIQLELKMHPECHEIIFQDDGGGLNYDKIRRRAEQLGRNLSSEEELRQIIFEPGFSTSEQVTELAGRGVGLDAIHHALQMAGGRIFLHSEEGAYCAFQILLPLGLTSSAS